MLMSLAEVIARMQNPLVLNEKQFEQYCKRPGYNKEWFIGYEIQGEFFFSSSLFSDSGY